MRMRQVFDNLLSLCKLIFKTYLKKKLFYLNFLVNRYVSSADHKEYAIKVYNQMCNVKSIIYHFTPRIDAWSTTNHIPSLTEQQVLEIVRTNYDSLTLKLEEDLDHYERYQENPQEINFFINLVSKKN